MNLGLLVVIAEVALGFFRSGWSREVFAARWGNRHPRGQFSVKAS